MPQPLRLHEDRYFDPDPTIRRAAHTLYEGTRDLPIVSPHGHVEPALLAENEPFPEPTSLIVTPDHYVIRMLYSRGVPMEALGIPTRDGTPFERDPRRIWQLFADHYYLFRGTPTGACLDYHLAVRFGVRERLDGDPASRIYDRVAERLRESEYLPRALYDEFDIEVLATTDGASDSLAHHRAIRESGWPGVVIPTFRPDAAFRIAAPGWKGEVEALERATDSSIASITDFIGALESRRRYFKQLGATATDHGVLEPFTERLSPADADRIF